MIYQLVQIMLYVLLYATVFLFAMLLVKLVKKLSLLKSKPKPTLPNNDQELVEGLNILSQIANAAGITVETLLQSGKVKVTVVDQNINYPDKDGDGVPDVFQRRKPLSEVLEFEKESSGHQNDYWFAAELPARYPTVGEYFIHGGQIKLCTINYTWPKSIIVKSVPGTNLDDLVDLTK